MGSGAPSPTGGRPGACWLFPLDTYSRFDPYHWAFKIEEQPVLKNMEARSTVTVKAPPQETPPISERARSAQETRWAGQTCSLAWARSAEDMKPISARDAIVPGRHLRSCLHTESY